MGFALTIEPGEVYIVSRSSRKLLLLSLTIAAALTSTGCGQLGGLIRFGSGFVNSPLGAILSIGSQLLITGINNLPNPVDADQTAGGIPVVPFKIGIPSGYTPLLNGTLLTGLIDEPHAAAIGPDGFLYFTERETGRVRKLDLANPANPQVVLDLHVNAAETRGLLGICFTPPGVTPALMYLTYVRSTTDADTTSEPEGLEARVSSFPVSNLDPAAETVLFRHAPRDPGSLAIKFADNGITNCYIGPDQKLYYGFGDWGTRINSQNTDPNIPAGKIHRVNLDGSIPADNPISGNSAYAWGFRYPTAMAWDSLDNQMWMSERGWQVSDELNTVVSGGNYGYPLVQGTSNTSFEQLMSAAGILYKNPSFDFAATKPIPALSGLAIIRSSVYRADAQGDVLYSYANLVQFPPIIGPSLGRVGRMHYPKDALDLVVFYGDAWQAPQEAGAVLGLVTIPDGHVVALCRNGIYRLDDNTVTP